MLRFFLVLLLLLQPLAGMAANEAQPPVFADPAAGLKKLQVAVLPFSTPKGMPDLEQYGEGTMDSLITALVNIPQFVMVDRGRIDRVMKEQAFDQTGLVDPKTAVKLGKLVAAQALIMGSMQSENNSIRITASFVDVQTGKIRLSKQVTGTSIFDLQDDLARQFIAAQQVKPTTEQQQRVTQAAKSTANREAYAAYLKGRKAYLTYTSDGYIEATQWYRRATDLDPNYSLAYAAMSQALLAHGWERQQNGDAYKEDYEQAYDLAQQAVKLSPELADGYRELGVAMQRLDITQDIQVGQSLSVKASAAEEQLRKALAINPNDAMSWYTLWISGNWKRNPDHEYIIRALLLEPDLVPAHYDRGACLIFNKQYEAAIAEFRRVLQINPRLISAYSNIGNALDGLGRHDDAIAAYRQAIAGNANDRTPHFNLALVLAGLKRYNDAVPEFQEALRIDSRFAPAHEQLGLAYGALGRNDDALTELKAAVALDPERLSAYYNLGQQLSNMQRFPEAIAILKQVLQMKPDAVGALYGLSLAYYQEMAALGFDTKTQQVYLHGAKAVELLQQAIKLAPQEVELRRLLGTLLYQLGSYPEALVSLQQTATMAPKMAFVYDLLSRVFNRMKRYDEAVKAAQTVMNLDPQDPAGPTDLGRALMRRGQVAEAEQAFQAALKLDANNSGALYSLAALYAARGRRDDALAALQKAVALNAVFKKQIGDDEDFKSLQADARFKALTAP